MLRLPPGRPESIALLVCRGKAAIQVLNEQFYSTLGLFFCDIIEYLSRDNFEKFSTWVRGLGFRNHTFGYTNWRPNHTLAYGKLIKIVLLTIGNVTQITNFEANLYEIGHILPKSCYLVCKNCPIRPKWPKSVDNIRLATEPQPQWDPWLR